MTRTSIPAERYATRLERARDALRDAGASALLLSLGPDMRWLTGYGGTVRERLSMLVLPVDGTARLVVPRLEATPARSAPAAASGAVEVVAWEETEDPWDRVDSALPASAARERLLVSDTLWAMFLLPAQRRFSAATWELASQVMRELRIVKDAEEVALLREAAHAADRVIDAMAAGRLSGRTEADVEREVRDRLVAEGHDEASFAIVASGPNSASPHHEAGDRVLGAGESLVLDIGGTVAGYGSDTTRTLWLADADGSGPPADFATLFSTLLAAQREATAAVAPGVPCERIDQVARDRITDAGFGEAFIHRTGHGIGLEGHEHPYVVQGNAEPLQVGHAFSVEPGIYLEGRYGARIEDIVVCAPEGPDVLNESDRDLRVVLAR
jgi:Xaa-Pro aminopeptidase